MITQLMAFLLAFDSSAHAASRIFTADEVSNTVSVIDPENEVLTGVIYLGGPRTSSYSNFTPYNSQINVHGIDYSVKAKLLAVTSNITNTVTLIDLEGKGEKDISFVPVGRSPHTSNFTPDGKELWANVRGEDFISVIDVKSRKVKQTIKTAKAPSFTAFLSRKPLAFVSNCWTRKLEVFDRLTKKRLKEIPMPGTFAPVSQLSPDEKELWVIQKDINSVVRIDTEKMEVIETLQLGNFLQHPAFLQKNGITYGMVTGGGEDKVSIFSMNGRETKLTQEVTVTGVPHSLWSNRDGSKIFVASENSDTLKVIHTEDYKVKNTIKIGASPQAMVFVNDLDPVILERFEKKFVRPLNYKATTPAFKLFKTESKASASVAMRNFGNVDFFVFQLFGMTGTKATYNVYLTTKSGRDLDWSKQELIGIVSCIGINSCIDYASFPKDQSRLDRLSSQRIVIIDSATKQIEFEQPAVTP